ncbi:MAG: ABC transporter ATP-binding protein [Eubacteriales bacterium]|nr:ABC transporter ATP-binding protein [Eubacteriales bacterium]
MHKYFQKRYALSEEGARGLLVSIITHSLVFLSYVLPASFGLYFIKRNLETGDSGRLWIYILLALIFMVLMYVIGKVDYNKLYTKMYAESAKMRLNLADKLKQLPLSFFDQKDVSDLSSTIMDDVTEFEMLFSHAVPQYYAAFVNFVLISLALLVFDWRMALATIWVVPVSILVKALAQKLERKMNRALYQEKRVVDECLQEGFEHAQEIYAYGGDERYLKRVDQAFRNYEKIQLKAELVAAVLMQISSLILRFGLPSIVLIGAYLYFAGSLPIVTYLIFIIMSQQIYKPIEAIVQFQAALKMLDVRVERVREMNELPVQKGRSDFSPDGYDIVFEDVSFSYEEGQVTVKDLSFTAKQGEVTALVGPSGGGKTTVTKLAARFWDVNSGKITLGGVDISTVEPEALLKHFSIVFQDVALFDGTVLENIRLGKKEATDEEVLRAARIANCDPFVERLPDGYATEIGENGARLSGGERQRISIARAILKDAPIILLDEATASVDVESESQIQKGLSELIRDKTVLLIAHRMRTVAAADKVLVLAEGQLVESGKPEELKNLDGIFAKMLRRQSLS